MMHRDSKNSSWHRFVSAFMLTSLALCHTAGKLQAVVVTDESAVDNQQEAEADNPLDDLKKPDDTGQIRDESESLDPANKDALAWYMAGQKAMKRGDLQPAADAFEKAAEASPKSAIPLRALSMVLLRMGRVEEGTKIAGKAIELDPDDVEMRLQLAVFYAATQKIQESISMLNEALESKTLKRESREFVQLHQVRAAILLATRNLREAADSYEILLEALESPEDFKLSEREHKALASNRPTSYETIGRIMLEVGRHDKAVEAFEAIGRIEKEQPGEHNLLLARAYFLKDKLADCERNLNEYFESGRRSNESLQMLLDLYAATNRSDSLADRLGELSQKTSDATTVRMFLGQVLLDQGKIADARNVYQSILDSSGEADAYLGLVRVEIFSQNSASLIATLNRAARSQIRIEELTPLIVSITTNEEFARNTVTTCQQMYSEKPGDLHPVVPYFCALIAEPLKMRTEAGELFKAAIELNPDRQLMVQILDKYGVNQLTLGEFAMAIKIMEQQLSIPGLPPAERINTLFRLSMAYASNEDIESARRVLKEALQMVPNEPQLLDRLARVEAADGNMEAAEQLLEKAIPGFPEDSELLPDSLILLASIKARMDKWESAIDQYLRVLESPKIDNETLRLVRMSLSNAYVQSGNLEKGEEIMEEIYAEDPTDPGVNNDLGYLYADQGKELERAEKMIRLAVEAQPENPAYLDSLGWVLFKQGRNEEALIPLKKANSDPEYRDATLLEHQGDVHQALTQNEEANDLWSQALKVEQGAVQPDTRVIERLKSKLGDAAPTETKAKE